MCDEVEQDSGRKFKDGDIVSLDKIRLAVVNFRYHGDIGYEVTYFYRDGSSGSNIYFESELQELDEAMLKERLQDYPPDVQEEIRKVQALYR